MFLGLALVTVIQLLFTARPTLFPFQFLILLNFLFLHSFTFFRQCVCFYNEYGSVSLCIRFIQWKTADDQEEQILNFPDMAISLIHSRRTRKKSFLPVDGSNLLKRALFGMASTK